MCLHQTQAGRKKCNLEIRFMNDVCFCWFVVVYVVVDFVLILIDARLVLTVTELVKLSCDS